MKLITYDRYFLNLKINSILENMYFLNIFNEGNVLTFLKKSNIFFSVVRSPFVYKKSMEQFFLQKFKGTFMSNKFCYNFFLQVYEEEQLKNKLKEEVILKYCYKLVLDSSKNNETI